MKALRKPATRLSSLIQAQHAARVATSAATCSQTASFGFEDVPEEEKATRVGKVFGGVASSYDLMNDLMSAGLHRYWKDRLVDCIQAFPGMSHIDVAGGTGDVATRVLAKVSTACEDAARSADDPVLQDLGRVVVCDVNAAMLNEGKQRHGDGRLQWVLGDAERLPFEDSCMDSYTVAFGIRNVTRIAQALREARRKSVARIQCSMMRNGKPSSAVDEPAIATPWTSEVLKPGGQFLCLEFSHVALPGLKQLYDTYSFNVIPRIGRWVAGDEDSYRYLVESIRRFPKQGEFADMIHQAGLGRVKYDNLSGGIVAIHSAFRSV